MQTNTTTKTVSPGKDFLRAFKPFSQRIGILYARLRKTTQVLWLKPHPFSLHKCRLWIFYLGWAGLRNMFPKPMIYYDKTVWASVFPTAKWFWGLLAPKLLAIRWEFPISIKADPTGLLSGNSLLSGSANWRVNLNAAQIVLPKVLGQLYCFSF